MKKLFTFLLFTVPFISRSQTICCTSDEGGTVTLTAPAGMVITAINFASYGTPNGSCGSFTLGGCNSLNSVNLCNTAFLGRNSASINATNAVFGDPCGGTFKRLYVQATYSNALPLKLISFSAKKSEDNQIKLEWSSSHELNTSTFVIERSGDGVDFYSAGSVPAQGSGNKYYGFTDPITQTFTNVFYRLKMMDIDGKFTYSPVVRIFARETGSSISVFPNPTSDFLTINNKETEEIAILSSTGQLMKRFKIVHGSVTVNIADLRPGIYILKAGDEVTKFAKQ
jgi:hypothetical protein